MIRLRLRVFLSVAGVLLALGASRFASAQDPASGTDLKTHQLAASVCASCHGPSGISSSPLFPRLAGQQRAYSSAQLKSFKARTRGEPDAHDYMWGMASLLDDAVIEDLAGYYAAQAPAHGIAGNPDLVARGRSIYQKGDQGLGVAACASCHGDAAQGQSIFPRLAGQHAAYVIRQLEAIQRNARDSPIMHGVIKELDTQGVKAVAEYVQSLD